MDPNSCHCSDDEMAFGAAFVRDTVVAQSDTQFHISVVMPLFLSHPLCIDSSHENKE